MINRRNLWTISVIIPLLLASGCMNGPDPPPGQPPADGAPPEAPPESGDSAPETPPSRDTSTAVPTRDAYIQQPFAMEAGTTAAVIRAFGQPDRIEREPVENRHVAGQIDTVVTLHYGDAEFEFYRVTGGREFLDYATVRSNRYLRYPRPGIGTPVDSLVAWFGPPTERSDSRLRYERTQLVGAEEPVIFIVQDGRIRRIEYLPYVD